MTPASRFSLLVGITVAAGGLLMVPRHSEWIAMLRDEGDEARVIAALEPALAQNPHDPQTLGTLGRAYADVGKDQAAIDLLKRYVILQPDDAEAYFTLATVYERTGDISQQTQALRDGLSLKPDAQHIRQLALLYAYQARAGEEFDLLTRFSNDLTIGSGLVVRLAELQKQRGDIAAAIETLRRADVTSDSLPPEATLRARLLLAGFLVEARQPDLLVRFGGSGSKIGGRLISPTNYSSQSCQQHLMGRLSRSLIRLRIPTRRYDSFWSKSLRGSGRFRLHAIFLARGSARILARQPRRLLGLSHLAWIRTRRKSSGRRSAWS